MPECAKAHLQQYKILEFFGGSTTDSPLFGVGVREGENKPGRERK